MGVVTIQVTEKGNSRLKTFVCDQAVLADNMRYFRQHFKKIGPGMDFQIHIQCDLDVFDWLFDTMRRGRKSVPLQFEVAHCLPILVASTFLQMPAVIKGCVEFIVANLDVVLQQPELLKLDRASFNHIARETSEILLEEISLICRDTPGLEYVYQVLQRLYKHKLGELLSEQQTRLERCTHCNGLFSLAAGHKLKCKASKQLLHGRTASFRSHKIDPAWNLTRYWQDQRSGGSDWRTLFWEAWGLIHVFFCNVCEEYFPAKHYTHCPYHTQPPFFIDETQNGFYPCCGRPAWHPSLAEGSSQGCQGRPHKIRTNENEDDDCSSSWVDLPESKVEILLMFHPLVVVPYDSVAESGGMSGVNHESDEEMYSNVTNIPSTTFPQDQNDNKPPSRSCSIPLVNDTSRQWSSSIANESVTSDVPISQDDTDLVNELPGVRFVDTTVNGSGVTFRTEDQTPQILSSAPKAEHDAQRTLSLPAFSENDQPKNEMRDSQQPSDDYDRYIGRDSDKTGLRNFANPLYDRTLLQDMIQLDDEQRMQSLVHKLLRLRFNTQEGSGLGKSTKRFGHRTATSSSPLFASKPRTKSRNLKSRDLVGPRSAKLS